MATSTPAETRIRPPATFLRRVLFFDALTGLNSIPLALASGLISPFLGLPTLYLFIKFGLFGFYGVWLFFALWRDPIPQWISWPAIVWNIAVSGASLMTLVLDLYAVTTLGWLLLMSIVVGAPVLSAVQYVGARRYYR
ncbi:MAG: hypothetical protein AAGF95_29395 [Chloroflexota bacterium]